MEEEELLFKEKTKDGKFLFVNAETSAERELDSDLIGEVEAAYLERETSFTSLL